LIDHSDIIANCEHNSQDYMLARSRNGEGTLKLELREDGVYFSFDAPETEKGNDILYHVRQGNIFECSFAFTLPEKRAGEKWYKEDGKLKRDISRISGLYDISLVGRAAYSDTFCYNRSIPEDVLKEFEDKPKEDEIEVKNNSKTIKTNKIMEKRFSFINAINQISNNKNLDELTQAVNTNGQEEMRKAGIAFGGQIQLPVSELRANVTVTGEGEDIVATDLYDVVKPLREKNVLVQAGAQFLTGLVGDIQVPKMAATQVSWATETGAAGDGAGAFSNVKLTPKRLTAYVNISKQTLNQTSFDVENLIREDIVRAINNKLEESILGAVAVTNGPSAHLYDSTNAVLSCTTMAKVAEVEEAVEEAKTLGDKYWIVNPKFKAVLRDKAKGANVSQSLFANGEIDGSKVLVTGNVGGIAGKGLAIYGDFSNLVIGQWGAIKL
jgi:HK97 family phage major capsid protein/HK97 family phage prohead protease